MEKYLSILAAVKVWFSLSLLVSLSHRWQVQGNLGEWESVATGQVEVSGPQRCDTNDCVFNTTFQITKCTCRGALGKCRRVIATPLVICPLRDSHLIWPPTCLCSNWASVSSRHTRQVQVQAFFSPGTCDLLLSQGFPQAHLRYERHYKIHMLFI